jgi:magnesium chelatase family protein
LAVTIVTILPPFSFEEALECTKIQSISGLLPANAGLVTTRPFRAPHHSVSDAGLIGGAPGASLSPSRARSASRTTVSSSWTFLPEFEPEVREVLRQPPAAGKLAICRATVFVNPPSGG